MAVTKHVLFVHQAAELYGSDRVLLNIVGGLIGTEFIPIVILPHHGRLAELFVELGVEVHFCDVVKISRATFSVGGAVDLLRSIFRARSSIDKMLNGRKIDIVYSNTVAVFGGALWSFGKRKKHIWHIHEVIHKPRIASVLFPYLVRIFSDKAVFISSATQNWMVGRQPALRAKSEIVFNGIVEGDVDAEGLDRLRSNLNISEGKVVLSLVGRINRWKGQDLFLRAIRLLLDKGISDIVVLIVGDAPDGQEYILAELKSLAGDLGVSELVRFVEFREDVWPVWAITDIAVVPSTEPEPFGMVAIEAMSVGKPVVAAAHGGLIDIIVDNESGLLFEPGNVIDLCSKLERLIIDPQLRRRFGLDAKKRQVANFSIGSQVKSITRLLRLM